MKGVHYETGHYLQGEGATKRWGASEVLPVRKGLGGGGNLLAMLKGEGGTTSFGVVLTQELEIWAILKGGEAQKVSTLS